MPCELQSGSVSPSRPALSGTRLAVHSGVRTVEELRQLVYGDLDVELQRAAEASIRAHVVHMREQGEEVSAIAGLDDVSLAPEEA